MAAVSIVCNCSRLYLFIWTSLWKTNLYFTLNEILVGIVLNIWTYLNIWYYLFSLFRYLISHLCLVTTSSGQNWLASLLNIVDSIPNLEQVPANPTYHSSIVQILCNLHKFTTYQPSFTIVTWNRYQKNLYKLSNWWKYHYCIICNETSDIE